MTTLRIKELIAQAAWTCALLEGLKYLRFGDWAVVLMYHRVISKVAKADAFLQPGMYITPDTFRQQAAFLKENFHVLPLNELIGRVESGQKVGECCAITFDDGWHDNFTNAFPVLREFQLPATIFLATSFIGTNKLFWPEEFTYYLQHSEVKALAKENQVLNRFFGKKDNRGREEHFLDNAILTMKTFFPDKREEILRHLRSIYPLPTIGRQLMNWEEAKEMQSSGMVSFGAHSANHVILDQVSLQEAEEEIIRSMQELENRLGVRSMCFAYPNGNFNKDLQCILKRNGFRGAVTTRKGWVSEDTALFEIPRIGMHEDVSRTIPLFLARILLKSF